MFAIDLIASLSFDPVNETPNPVMPKWQLISPGGLSYPTVDSLDNVYYASFLNSTFSVAGKISDCRRNLVGAT